AVRQVMNYLENGNIINSVNYPNCDMGKCTKAARMLILHKNIPNSLGQFTSAVAKENVNISDLLNRSRGDYACTMLDLDSPVPQKVVDEICGIEGVFRVRVIA
ncbi:MAG: 3-phosphoglycerate dehydrogenase, partial [Peptococcaceae bacterium]|nr:3-phosphoglycerate dehydrogenase [Peptococcaceae bacterium]